MPEIVLLGPQGEKPNIREAVRRLGLEGPFCAVTAGWQERAGELDALREHLNREVVNLELYFRAEEVFEQDREYFAAYRQRQNLLQELQDLYRLRLSYLTETVLRLSDTQGTKGLLERDRASSIDMVRQLDRQHLERTHEIFEDFEQAWHTHERPAVAAHIREVRQIVASCSAIFVAGGHVAALLNRLRLFNLLPALREKPVVAWSAGAMVLSERIVLFHDSPPQGAGAAEVLGAGLGCVRGIVPLPHARKRLRLEVPARVALLARRFQPAQCLAMDAEALLHGNGDQWQYQKNIYRLCASGCLDSAVVET